MTAWARSRGILSLMDGTRPVAADEDEALVESARRGDRAAYDALVRRHLDRVWHVVRRIVRDDEDAEDVTQEVFLTAWQGLARFRGEARFTTWLHSIAVTRALNHLDRAAEKLRRQSGPLEDPEDEEGRRDPRPAVEAASARPASPLEELEAAELRRRLAWCLERLPAPWRAVLALRDAEERSYEEIAGVLGLALGTVRSRLARARLSLKECIEGHAS